MLRPNISIYVLEEINPDFYTFAYLAIVNAQR
jgi:hypothetical protein